MLRAVSASKIFMNTNEVKNRTSLFNEDAAYKRVVTGQNGDRKLPSHG